MSDLQVTYSPDVFAQRVGGVSRYFGQLIRDLPEFGVDARAIAGFHDNEYLRSLPRGKVRGIALPLRPARLSAQVLPRLNRLTRRWWEPNSGIFHPSYYTAPPPRRHLPTVVTVYDMIHELFPTHFATDDPTPRLKSEWVKRADAIVAISESTRRDLVDILGISTDQVTVIYPGIEPAPPVDPSIQRSDDIVLYVGHRGLYKNWSTVVAALATPGMQKLRLVCFGGGKPRREESQLLSRHGLTDRTQFVGGSDRELSRWYRRAAVLAYPSLYEGYGYPPLEAIAHRCPVVCSRTSSLVETMEGVAFFVDDPLIAPAFSEAILQSLGASVSGARLLPTCSEAARRHADLYRSL